MVCLARVVSYAQGMSAGRVLDYNNNPTLCRPPPQPIPVLETDDTGNHLLCVDHYVTMVLLINLGRFHGFRGAHRVQSSTHRLHRQSQSYWWWLLAPAAQLPSSWAGLHICSHNITGICKRACNQSRSTTHTLRTFWLDNRYIPWLYWMVLLICLLKPST
jgi:hypothetical protein